MWVRQESCRVGGEKKKKGMHEGLKLQKMEGHIKNRVNVGRRKHRGNDETRESGDEKRTRKRVCVLLVSSQHDGTCTHFSGH